MSFYERLSEFYDRLFPAGAAQVEFVTSLLPEEAYVLDAAAGTGNLAVELCKRGHTVTALDLDASMVERMEAKRSALEPHSLNPLCMDMRHIDSLPQQSFDAVVCVGNSIVHLADAAEIGQTLAKMRSLLKSGGILILQTVNYDRILDQGITELPLLKHSGIDGSAVAFQRSYEQLSSGQLAFHGQLIVERDGQAEEHGNTVELIPMRRGLLERLLAEAGFDSVTVYGSFKGEPHGPNAAATVVTARRPVND